MDKRFNFSVCVLGAIIVLAACSLCGCINHKADMESAPSVLNEQASVDALIAEEKSAREKEVLELARTYQPLYEQADKGTVSNVVLSETCVREIAKHIAGYGHTVIGFYQDMAHYEPFEEFLLQALEGHESSATYYSVSSDGSLSRRDFRSEEKRLFVTSTSVTWDETMNPVIGYSDSYIIDQWQYTDKGYFTYEIQNSSPWRYSFLRVRPLGERAWELWETYIRPIGYQGNNLFLIEWDQSGMEQIAFNDLYENLYYMETGKLTEYNLSVGSISAEEFEPLVLKYFGITVEFLRENTVYYEEKNRYFWEPLTCSRHDIWFPAAEPEVVDYWDNEDGTITMVVDAVDIYRGKDRAFTHEVTVQVFEDGSFQYVSNRIRPEDKGNVPSYTPRSEPLY